MDWIFTEYVYGAQLPSYQMSATFDTGADGWADGDVGMSMKMTQSNVNDNFPMLVPSTWNCRVACLPGKSSPYRQQLVR